MRNYALHQAEQQSALSTGLIGRLWANWQARRAVARLAELDDHLLRDIGMNRHAIKVAMATSLSENAVLRLETSLRENQPPRRTAFSTELSRSSARLPDEVPPPVMSSMVRRPRVTASSVGCGRLLPGT